MHPNLTSAVNAGMVGLGSLSAPPKFGRFQIWVAVPPSFGFGEIAFLGFPIEQFPHPVGVGGPAVGGVPSPTGWLAGADGQAGGGWVAGGSCARAEWLSGWRQARLGKLPGLACGLQAPGSWACSLQTAAQLGYKTCLSQKHIFNFQIFGLAFCGSFPNQGELLQFFILLFKLNCRQKIILTQGVFFGLLCTKLPLDIFLRLSFENAALLFGHHISIPLY
ncbi:hypothetical protein DSO57_1034716 [Entomophthora muscae]|uniref:Uncharacterized protein n=1 Tax=Entomophthora muscae TaxID=34485 RepID=A0ACC2REI0_9FUNG|nr:hypothetical protein DSO57_1034716 [Entomophthora muscae]